jgi:hypothetical protein
VIDQIARTQVLDEDDDVKTPEWRGQRKHVFILSDSGKPVYSRYTMLNESEYIIKFYNYTI